MTKPICYGASKSWYRAVKGLGANELSFRQLVGRRRSQPTIVAVGGNSFKGAETTTARNIIDLFEQRQVVITHGNGPQVGTKLEDAEKAGIPKTIYECTAETQLEMGAALAKSLVAEAKRMGIPATLVTPEVIPTRVIVDPNDGAFKNPTKYIGREFPLEKFGAFSKQNENGLYKWEEEGVVWLMKEVPGKPGTYRRVVPSPKPIAIHYGDMETINEAIAAKKLVIAVGGGGIPIFTDGTMVDAVIDKDLATALLCRELKARELIISTGVEYVAHGYKTPKHQDIAYYWTKQALNKLLAGEYPAGAMGEKIEAAVNVLRDGVNQVLITSPDVSWKAGEGTVMTRGLDLTGRFHSLAISLGLASDELQRWLVK